MRQLLIALALLTAAATAHAERYFCRTVMHMVIAEVQAASPEEALDQAKAQCMQKGCARPPILCLTPVEFQRENHAINDRYEVNRQTRLQVEKAKECHISDSVQAQQYARAAFAVKNGCVTPLSSQDLIFVGAVGEALMERCDMAITSVSKQLAQFIGFAVAAGAGGGVGGLDVSKRGALEQSFVGSEEALRSQALGGLLAGDKCDKRLADSWLSGLDRYLTLSSKDEGAQFVNSCVEVHRGVWSQQKCECVRDGLRIKDPRAPYKSYSAVDVKEAVTSGAGLGIALMGVCNMPTY